MVDALGRDFRGNTTDVTDAFISWVTNLQWEDEPLVHEYGWSLPLSVCAFYVAVVLVYRHLALSPRPDSALVRWLLLFWNALLCIYSLFCTVGFSYRLAVQAQRHGRDVLLCDPEGVLWRGVDLFAVWAFLISKFVELGDTVFLMVRGRPVNFLHWYHHVSVLLYCWHANETHTSLAIPFGTINALVHTVMYFYYMLSALGLRPAWGEIVTQMQLLQMVAGLALSTAWAVLAQRHPCYSTQPATSIVCAAVLYASYLALFVQFYVQRWMSGRVKVKAE